MHSMWKESQLREFRKRGIDVTKPSTKCNKPVTPERESVTDVSQSSDPSVTTLSQVYEQGVSKLSHLNGQVERRLYELGEKSLPNMVEGFEKHIIQGALKHTENHTEAAKLLKITRRTLLRKLEKHNIS